MRRPVLLFLVVFSITLGGSLGLNAFLFKWAMRFRAAYAATQLDPLGLGAHPRGPQAIDRRKGAVVVVFGDSRAAQWPAPAEVQGAQFLNRGVAGETSAQAVGRFSQHVTPLQPDCVIIQLGINDLKSIAVFPERNEAIIQQCQENLRRVVDLSLASGARVIITTVFPTGPVPLARRPFWSEEVAAAISELNAFIHSLKRERVEVFDPNKMLVTHDGFVRKAFSLDFLHLNAEGYAALNRELAAMLR